MKPRSREVNIFNLSMLDVLTCALGAFLIIMIILLPYYKKESIDYQTIIKQLQRDIVKVKADKKKSDNALKAAQAKINDSLKFSFLGIATKAESFVIIVDMSGSMKEYGDVMYETVSKIINLLKPNNRLQIIGYNGEAPNAQIYRWRSGSSLASMGGSNNRSAKQFVNSLIPKFDGGTPTHDALKEALGYNAKAIILLTDGKPNGSPSSIISDITRRNGGQKEIHCVAIGDYRSNPGLTKFLMELADNNKGDFLGVSN